MQYATVAQLTARSAWETLLILDSQGRKDARKVARFSAHAYELITSQQAKQTYRALWQLTQITCMVAIALGMSARATWDRLVEAQQIPATAPVAAVQQPTAETVAPVQPEILALPAPAAPIALLPAPAAPIALLPAHSPLHPMPDAQRPTPDAQCPMPNAPTWQTLKGEARKAALRKACTQAGIQWRHKQPSGKWKMLTIAQMEAALA